MKLRGLIICIAIVFITACENPAHTTVGGSVPRTLRCIVTRNNDEPCEGAQVYVKYNGEKYGTRYVTDSNGIIVIKNAPNGIYTIEAAKSGYISKRLEQFELTDNVEVELKLPEIPEGIGVYSYSARVVTDDNTPAIVAIAQLASANMYYGDAALCDEKGKFTISNLMPGIYSLFISSAGYEVGKFSDIKLFGGSSPAPFMIIKQSAKNSAYTERTDGDDTNNDNSPDSKPVPKYIIRGIISIAEGGFAAGATVQLRKNGALCGDIVTTGVGGNYSVYNVAPGYYSIQIYYPNHSTRYGEIPYVKVSDENLSAIDFVFKKTYSIGGRGPAGGWIIAENNGKYIELAPTDVAGPYEDGKAIFGSHRNPDKEHGVYDSEKNTAYIVNQHKLSQGGDFIETGLAAVLCTEYISNGYNDWVLPTVQVFKLIKENEFHLQKKYNLRLNEQYWCSDSATWNFARTWTEWDGWQSVTKREESLRDGHSKFRFEPPLSNEYNSYDEPDDFLFTRNGHARYFVRPVRYF